MIGEAALLKILGAGALFGAKAYKDFAGLKAEDFGEVAKALGGAFVPGGDTRADMGDFVKGVQQRIADTLDKRTMAEAGRKPEDIQRDRENALEQFNETLPKMAVDRALFARVDFDAHAVAGAMVEQLSRLNDLFSPPQQGRPRSIANALAYEIFFQTFELAEQKKAFCETLFVNVHREVLSRLGRIEDKQDRTLDELADIKAQITALALAKGIPEEPLRKVLARFGEEHVPVGEIPERLARKADELVFLRQELARLRHDRPEFAALRAAALKLIDDGKFDEARAELRKGRELAKAIREEHAREEASFLRHEARIDRLNLDYEAAIAAYRQATALDPDNLFAWGELGDLWMILGNLGEALKAYEGLETACRRQGDERNLSISYERIGDVRVAQGDLAGALKVFQDGLALREKLTAADPRNTGWQRDLSVSQERIGDVRSAQGGLAGALKAFQESLAIREKLAAADPRNTQAQFDLGIANERIGNVHVAKGNLTEALQAYQKRHDLISKLAAADPRNTQWQRDLSVSHNRIGDVRSAQGNLAGALKAFEDSLAIAEKLAAADPRNTQWQRDLSVSHEKIGDVRVAQGDLAGALKAFQASLAIAEKLAIIDPRNTQWQRDLSVSHDRIGDVRSAQGDLAGALKAFQASLAIAEKLAATDPRNTPWQRDLSYSLTVIGQTQERLGNTPEALEAYTQSLAIDERLAALDPTNAMWRKDVGISRANVARLSKP